MSLQGNGWEVRVGDSLRLLRELDDASVDCVITDCPYSSGGAFRGDRAQSTRSKYAQTGSARQAEHVDFAGDTRDQRGFAYWCALWYSELLRVTVPGALLFSFTDWRQLPTTTDAMQAGGWVWRGIAAWNKTLATRPQSGPPRAQCEFVAWGTNGGHRPDWEAGSAPGFWTHRSPGQVGDVFHIAEKPVAIMRDLARLCPPGGLILDPFAGSGTTGEAALLEERRVLLFELLPDTAEVAAERCRAVEAGSTIAASRAGQGALFESEAPDLGSL